MTIYEQIKKRIDYAKQSYPYETIHLLYQQHGAIEMAYQLGALTKEEMSDLEYQCIHDGINNPKYFDRGD
jgi:hypothetical protein